MQQRSFAGAVCAYDADLLRAADAKADIAGECGFSVWCAEFFQSVINDSFAGRDFGAVTADF